MAGADASIYNMIRPQAMVKLEDPDEIQAKRLTLQNLMQQGEVGKLGLEQTRRGMAREDAFTRLFSGGRTPTDSEMFAVDPKGAAAALKARQDAKKTGAETGKLETETLEKALKIHYDMLKDVNDPQTAAKWITAGYNDPLLSPIMQRAGSPQEVIDRIPQDPKGFEDWRMRNGMGLEKFAADLREKQKISETGRHNLSTEANAAGQLAVSQGNLGVARGNLGVSRERLAHEKATPQRTYDADRGLVVNTRDGTAAPVLNNGAPIAPKDKPLNEFQSKGQLFGTRAAEADKIISELSAKGDNFPGSIKATAGEVPLVGGALAAAINPLPGFMGGPSAAQQKVEQAQRNFINAVLRVESGAVIAQDEFDNAKKQYFPQRGDTKEVIAQKAANRASAIEGLRVASGPAGARVEAARSPQTSTGKVGVDPSKLSDAELKRELGI